METSMDKKLGEISSLVKGLVDREKEKVNRQEWRKRNIATVECFKCHELGHYANDCPTLEERAPVRERGNNREN